MTGKDGRISSLDVYLSVGSNIDPERNIIEACLRLKVLVSAIETSTFYETDPLERPRQPSFLNGVWRIATDLPPRRLKEEVLRKIERELGRVRSDDKHAPRTIDLDIIIYGDRLIDEPDLKIPDPDIRVRPFIAVPLLELAPDLVLPDTGERLAVQPVIERGGELRSLPLFNETLKARIRE